MPEEPKTADGEAPARIEDLVFGRLQMTDSVQNSTERALRLRSLRPWARSRIVVLALMPLVVLVHAGRGVWVGLREGIEEARDAWRTVR